MRVALALIAGACEAPPWAELKELLLEAEQSPKVTEAPHPLFQDIYNSHHPYYKDHYKDCVDGFLEATSISR